MGIGSHLVQINARMKTRNIRAERYLYHRWRPAAQNLAGTRDLGYMCMVPHKFFWDHEITHRPHGTNIKHSWGRCFFLYHRLPTEVFFRRLPSRIIAWARTGVRRLSRKTLPDAGAVPAGSTG